MKFKLMSLIVALGMGVGSASFSDEKLEGLIDRYNNYEYIQDEGEDYWQTVKETKKREAGDCDDHAMGLALEAEKIGKELTPVCGQVYRKTITSNGEEFWINGNPHLYNVDYTKTPNVIYDTTNGLSGTREEIEQEHGLFYEEYGGRIGRIYKEDVNIFLKYCRSNPEGKGLSKSDLKKMREEKIENETPPKKEEEASTFEPFMKFF